MGTNIATSTRLVGLLFLLTFLLEEGLSSSAKLDDFFQPVSLKTTVYQNIQRPSHSDPGDAVLWQAPPYQNFAETLSPVEELARTKQALDILIQAALDYDPSLQIAKNKLKRKQLSLLTINLIEDFSQYRFQSQHNSEAESYIQTVLCEIRKQYEIYRESFFRSSRDPDYLQQIDKARAYLIYTCSLTALKSAEGLYFRGQQNEINYNFP